MGKRHGHELVYEEREEKKEDGRGRTRAMEQAAAAATGGDAKSC